MAEREISPQEKALVSDWNKRLEAALSRVEKTFKRFEKNRKLLSGKDPDDANRKLRTNLYFANMVSMLPQVYAKDPEFSGRPTQAVMPEQMDAVKKFASTAEVVLTKCLVKDAGLKKQSKKLLRSAYATSVGWLKASWQEKRDIDPLIINKIKDTQDNLDRLEQLAKDISDPESQSQHELKTAQLREALAGLETQQEITIARGVALDFVNSEDIIVIDDSVRVLTDYPRAAAIGHRVWMTPDQFKARFGYAPKKAKAYSEKEGAINKSEDKDAKLFCVWEIWSQDDNRIYYVCIGEEGFCEEPKSPDWTGKRWYPFFLLAFNEIDGTFYPISDIELIEELVNEYNKNREDWVRDRKGALPINVARKGGSLKDEDLKRIKDREGSDLVLVEGIPGTPLTNDIFIGSLSNLNPANYATDAARSDIEMIVGGGDAARGSVLKAKTATEAEILSQGLRGRSAERQDTLEDVFNELGPYVLEMLLRKMTEQEIKAIAGPDAVWPALSIDDIFNMVAIEVRGGSTGKPDRLQEQDRWTKLLPVIKEAVAQVSELREKGQDKLANAVIELTRETLRRFDERIDIEQFLPPPNEQEEDPAVLKQQLITMQEQLKMAMQEAKEANAKLDKGLIEAATQIATSAQPMLAAQSFQSALQAVNGEPMPEISEEPVMQDQTLPPEAIDQLQQLQ